MAERDTDAHNRFSQATAVPGEAGSGRLFDEHPATPAPVECLGIRFDSDDARREYFLGRLQELLPEMRKRPDFPAGDDADILRLSDPPYFTACPNPFLPEFLRHTRTPESAIHNASASNYHRLPYTGSITASSRHPVYSFHPYPTKVPPDIIRTLIEHYTEQGDVVFDGFCGTGMTGVAAREAGRYALISDLCPGATFISSINTRSHNWTTAYSIIENIIDASRTQWGHLYDTQEGSTIVPSNYFVWSDVFICPECVHEFPFFPHGVNHYGTKVETRRSFPCPACDADLNVRRIERVLNSGRKKSKLVWVNAGTGKSRINRPPTLYDMNLCRDIDDIRIAPWCPNDPLNVEGYSAKLAQLKDKEITDVSRFLTTRNRIVFSDLWERSNAITSTSIRRLALATLTSVLTVISERQGYFGGGGGMSGNLYMPIVRMEKNIYDVVARKLKKMGQAESRKSGLSTLAVVSTESSVIKKDIPDNCIDYIYTDPPFGDNIIYSEMNHLMESWIKIRTNGAHEAVIDATRERYFAAYDRLMRMCFAEFYRILKPGKWMTVEFHNTKASVWNLIQNALSESGFVVAQVGVLDKGSTTILADIRPGAAKLDLLISAYKPSRDLVTRFELEDGSEEGVWEFVRSHLSYLPVVVSDKKKLDSVIERHDYLLFDRMVAFHVQHGVMVPMSASQFYSGLRSRFAERDGMFFLSDQVVEYDIARITVGRVEQPELFVNNEDTSIRWLNNYLAEKPHTFQEIHPHFIRELDGWHKHEKMPELSTLLMQNFLCYDGAGDVPDPIRNYLLSSFKELGSQDKHDADLRAKAKNRWYVPDPNRAGDLEKLRERALLKEFDGYRQSPQRTLRVFRLEAVRAGFRRAWQDGNYGIIVAVADKIPDDVLQEDPKLLMWYDQAVTRTEASVAP